MKKQLISVLTAAAMLTGISALTAQASPRDVAYRNVLDAFRVRVTEGFANFSDEDNTTYGVLIQSDDLFSYLWYRGYTEYTLENAGYCFLDLNEDGKNELLIGSIAENGDTSLTDLYTIGTGTVSHIAAVSGRCVRWH